MIVKSFKILFLYLYALLCVVAAQSDRATLAILGKSDSMEATLQLLAAMHNPDKELADVACISFWEIPRPYTPEIMQELIQLLPTAPLRVQRKIAENFPTIVSVLMQRKLQPPLTSKEFEILQQLFMTKDPRLLKTMLANYFFFYGLPLPEKDILNWIAAEDTISMRALLLAPMWVQSQSLIQALTLRWPSASEAWKLQSVQMAWQSKEYIQWLQTHTTDPNELIGEMAKITITVAAQADLESLRKLRHELHTVTAQQHWVRILPLAGKAGMPLALAEIKPDSILLPNLINIWGIYQTMLPLEIAKVLLTDKRFAVRQFAFGYVTSATVEEASGWCTSEWADIRTLGIRFGTVQDIEPLLIDDNPNVRLAAILRWVSQNWPETEKILCYGLDDPLIQDTLLLTAVRQDNLAQILERWADSTVKLSKYENAKNLVKPTVITPAVH